MRLLPALLILLCTACTTPGAPVAAPSAPAKPPLPITACTEPRPEICTFEYLPVCASRDTGVRCVKAPCPATEWKTYGNACSACADAKVSGYVKGACASGTKP